MTLTGRGGLVGLAVMITLGLPGTLEARQVPWERASEEGVVRGAAPDSIRGLEAWVALALERNLGLKAAETTTFEARAEARGVRADLYPSVRLAARYSVAEGGRVIDIPVGQLVNPVYDALETLPEFPTGTFPEIADREVPFLRDREQDTRLEIRQAVVRPELWAGIRAADARRGAAEWELDAERARLRREVESAWYALRSAEQGVLVLASAVEVVEEALRTTEARAAAEEVTQDEVLRLRAERLDVLQQRNAAETRVTNARAAFNRLMDRPLDAAVATPPAAEAADVEAALARLGLAERDLRDRPVATRERLEARAVERRPELRALDRSLDAARAGVDAADAAWLPTFDVAVDLGLQGRDYSTGDGAEFVIASALLSWDLWTGGRRGARMERAELRRSRTRLLRDDAERGVRLEVRTVLDDVRLALEARDVAEERLVAAAEAFRLTERRHAEGLVTTVTLLDARDARTRAELDLNTVRYRLLDRLSALARAVAVEDDR